MPHEPRPRSRSLPWFAALTVLVVAAACGSTASSGTGPPTPASQAQATSSPTPTPLVVTASDLPGEASPGPSAFAPSGPTEEARVVRVVDGDTIVVDRGRGDEKVRYIGIDTPETVKPASQVEWMGHEAAAANRLLVEGQTVVLERDVSETDRYGRLLRDIWLHGDAWRLVNLELVEDGYARAYTYPPDVKYADLYLAAQIDAREHNRGLWGPGPVDFVSPEEGSTVSTKTITVRGTASAGSRIVRDIANAPDQSTLAKADGTWALKVTLKSGINDLKIRLGDEQGTTRTLRVTYAP